MRRRRFLQWIGAAGVGALGLAVIGRQRIKDLLLSTSLGQRFREAILGLDSTGATSDLSPADEACLWHLAMAVLPSNAGPEARPMVLEHLRWRARSEPGYAEEFAQARMFLDREATGRFGPRSEFVRLTPTETAQVVAELLEGIVAHQLSAAPRSTVLHLALSPHFRARYRLRRHTVNEIFLAYYTSPVGWARLHYRSFPGACAGLDIYSRPPDEASRQV